MPYLSTIFFDEQHLHALSDAEVQAIEDAMHACHETLRKSGHSIVAEAPHPVHVAPGVRVRSGRVSITDGPFAETNEQIGGFVRRPVKPRGGSKSDRGGHRS